MRWRRRRFKRRNKRMRAAVVRMTAWVATQLQVLPRGSVHLLPYEPGTVAAVVVLPRAIAPRP